MATAGYANENADVAHFVGKAIEGELPDIDGDLEVEDALREAEAEMEFDSHDEEEENLAKEAIHNDPVEIWGLNEDQMQGEASSYAGGNRVRHPQAVSPGDVAIESRHSILWRLVPFWMRHPLQRTFTPAVAVAAAHAAWFTMFAVAFSYPNYFLIPLFNIFSILFTKSIELIPKYQAISQKGLAYGLGPVHFFQTCFWIE